jgi:hypothetical protein
MNTILKTLQFRAETTETLALPIIYHDGNCRSQALKIVPKKPSITHMQL